MLRGGIWHPVVSASTRLVMTLMEAVKSPSRSRDPLVEEKEISSAQWKDGTSEPVMRGGIGVGACIEMAVV
jgi:hypothetical protein